MSKNREDQVAEPKEPKSSTSAPAEHDDDDDGGDDSPDIQTKQDGEKTIVEGSGETRGERRRRQREERIRQEREERRQLTETISALQRGYDALAARMAGPAQPAQSTQRQDEDSVDPEWDKLTDRQVELSQLMAQARTSDEQTRVMKEWRKVEFRKHQIAARGAVAPELERVKGQEPIEMTMVKQEFADVIGHPVAGDLAWNYAQIALKKARHEKRFLNPAQAARDALLQAGIEFGLRNVRPASPAPSDAQRGRFVASAPGGGGGATAAFSRPLTRREMHLAESWAEISGVPPEKAHVEWAKMMAKDEPNYFRDNTG